MVPGMGLKNKPQELTLDRSGAFAELMVNITPLFNHAYLALRDGLIAFAL